MRIFFARRFHRESIRLLGFVHSNCIDSTAEALHLKSYREVRLNSHSEIKTFHTSSRVNKMKVSVLGAGNGGCALAFHLVQLGHEVLLYQHKSFEHLFEEIRDSLKIIAVKETSGTQAVIHGESKITRATTSIKEAAEFSNYQLLIVPAYAQSVTFKDILPYLTKDHVLISLPGNFAFLDYVKVLHETSGQPGIPDIKKWKSMSKPCAFVETSTIPYACRLLGGNRVFIGGLKKLMHVGVFPSQKTDAVVESIKPLFALTLGKNKNVIETGFCNLNFILHPPITIYNAGWIETTKGNFLFYKEGLSPRVAHVMETLDQERVAVAASLGIEVEDIVHTWRKWYGIHDLNSMAEIPEKGKPYQFVRAPDTLDNRFISEDMVFVLIPIIQYIAKQNNVHTPLSDAIITSAKVITGQELKPMRHFFGKISDYANI